METPYECLVSGIEQKAFQEGTFFVAIARTLGIPARLNPDNKVMEYWVKVQFVSVLKTAEGGAVLTLKKRMMLYGTIIRTGQWDVWLE